MRSEQMQIGERNPYSALFPRQPQCDVHVVRAPLLPVLGEAVPQHADALDLHLHAVPVMHGANTVGRPIDKKLIFNFDASAF